MNPTQTKTTDPLTQANYSKEFGYNAPVTPTVTSADLAPTNTPKFSVANPNPIYPVGTLGTDLVATPQEAQASAVSQRIQELNKRKVGEAVFRAEQETQAGIPELNKVQKELQSRLTTIKNEAMAIPLKAQEGATGRGITAGGLAPIEAAATRQNAIQALSVNSLLEASRGNLSLAQDFVDKAVAQKYDPIKEEINALTSNLDLILKDPSTTLAEKNRAEAQKAIQEEKKKKIAEDEANDKATKDFVIKTLANNPTLDSVSIKALEASKTPLEAQLVVNELQRRGVKIGTNPPLTVQEKAELALKEAQTAKVYADIANANAETKAKIAATTVASDPVKTEAQTSLIKKSLANAYSLADASGNTGIIGTTGRFFGGADDYTQLVAETNTIRSNILTLATDPNIKKFFGPQMSNNDVQLMTSAGTTLNPELQKPEALKAELVRVADFIARAEAAVKKGLEKDTTSQDTQVVNGKTYVKAADGLYYPK